jgi:hypothetical protein
MSGFSGMDGAVVAGAGVDVFCGVDGVSGALHPHKKISEITMVAHAYPLFLAKENGIVIVLLSY